MHDPDHLARKLERTMRLYQAISYTDDLRPAQWQALRFFATAPAEKRSLGDFAEARVSTMETTSTTVTGLVNRGFLVRSRRDRNVGVQVTEKGRRYLEKSDPAKRLSYAIAKIPTEQRETLDDALARIMDTLERP